MSCSLNVDASQPGGLHAAARALVTLLAAGTGWDAAGTGRDDVVVCLGPGSHVLSAPLVLTSEHNHPRGGRVVWRGVGGATTVSAGVALDNAGWLPCGDGGPCPAPWESVWYSCRADISPTNRGDAAAATRMVSGDKSGRRRGRDVAIPSRTARASGTTPCRPTRRSRPGSSGSTVRRPS